MSEPVVGVLESIDAFQSGPQVYLVGEGVNPSTGWINVFLPGFGAGVDMVFAQYMPSGIVLTIMLPFVVTQMLCSEAPMESLTVRYREHFGPILDKPVPVRQTVTPSYKAVMMRCNPVHIFPANAPAVKEALEQGNKGEGPVLSFFAGTGTVFRRAIVSLDTPLDCCEAFPHPNCRGSTTTWYLEVRTPEEKDIAGALEHCLQEPAVQAVFMSLLSVDVWYDDAGSGAARDVLLPLLKPCLAARLGVAVELRLASEYACN